MPPPKDARPRPPLPLIELREADEYTMVAMMTGCLSVCDLRCREEERSEERWTSWLLLKALRWAELLVCGRVSSTHPQRNVTQYIYCNDVCVTFINVAPSAEVTLHGKKGYEQY